MDVSLDFEGVEVEHRLDGVHVLRQHPDHI